MAAVPYPLRMEAELDRPLSRWLWLVKWLLAIPHFVVLAFLWIAFVVLSVVAFFAILFTGRYPRGIFDFNVGVLRWTWRVSYYAYSALGTDRYPPFSLAEVPDYPTHLEVTYPEHLSRGLVLVKWWLLAIPHYLVVGVFVGGGTWAAWRTDHADFPWGPDGLIGLFVIIAAVVLAFTGRYPRSIFDFVLGMNRWALRVAAYAGLMTDAYPPFRFDGGGHEPEPGGTLTVEPHGGAPAGPGSPPPPEPPRRRTGWTAGRVVATVAGSLIALVSIGLASAGGAALWADGTQRAGGYLMTGTHGYAGPGYAVVADDIELWGLGSVLGDVRIEATAVDPAQPVFVGIAPAGLVGGYLRGVAYTDVRHLSDSGETTVEHAGGAVGPPDAARIWSAQASGTGTQRLTWAAESGKWAVVVVNADAAQGVAVRVRAGATLPWLGDAGVALVAGGLVFLAGSVTMIALAVRRASA